MNCSAHRLRADMARTISPASSRFWKSGRALKYVSRLLTLSLGEARRIAITAQGLDRPRPRRVGPAQIAAVIRKLGLVQLDFVNVVGPAHYQVIFSRLG